MIVAGFAIAERAIADATPDVPSKKPPPKRTIAALRDPVATPEPR